MTEKYHNRMMNITMEALKTASKTRKDKKTHHPFGVIVAPQEPTGSSKWAEWVKAGYLKRTDIYWAFRQLRSGREWLGISLDTGKGRGVQIDLTTAEGRRKLKDLENKFLDLLEKKSRPAEPKPQPSLLPEQLTLPFEREVSTPTDPRCECCDRPLTTRADGKLCCFHC